MVQIGGSDGFIIANVYRSPNSRVSKFKETIVELFEGYVDKGKLIIVGDFNLDVGNDKDRYARNLVNECAMLGLNQLVNVTTRSTLIINKIVNEIGCDTANTIISDNINNQKWEKFDRIKENDLDKIIKSLDDKKGYNNDVNSVIIKHLWNFDRNIILNIMNRSLENGIVPDNLKVSKIVPIQKIKESIKITDFRPINTLPVIEQVLESIVKSQLDKFFDNNKILNEEQSGFRKEHSCETAIQCSLIDWRQDIDNGLCVGVVFIDFARAFETISRIKLLSILSKLGIAGTVLD
ncbi:uncharacterized protein LOC123273807 [Cotesia glomerata]|uniref:uncharacterized protein LOC123273807 n=1 Tax=Cotesia glomerata TaxID=32391 RepID=UPI001D005F94|nr:uncharacterized protein LOC123273807 [Cotesia glomerata]